MRVMRKMFGVVALVLGALLFTQALVPVAASEPPAGRSQLREFSASATDRNGWRGDTGGEVQFYSNRRQFKIFGEVIESHGSYSSYADNIYLAIRENVNGTTQDGRWYGLCYSDESPSVPCDRDLDQYTTSGSGTSYREYMYIGYNNSGEYFQSRTLPGRGLRGIWMKVCHTVDGPDVCGTTRYVDNPYIAGVNV